MSFRDSKDAPSSSAYKSASGSGGSQAGKPTPESIASGAATVSWALETLGIQTYGFIGGAAVSLLVQAEGERARQTDDLDLIVQPTSTLTAESVSSLLTTHEQTKSFFVEKYDQYINKPFVRVAQHGETVEIPIEIFDWVVWPGRRMYYDLGLAPNAPMMITLNEQNTYTLNTGWLLRQKFLAYYQRNDKRESDMRDIDTLVIMLSDKQEQVTITDPEEITALKLVVEHATFSMKEWVLCEGIWPTVWTWDETYKRYYRYDPAQEWDMIWAPET